MCHKYCKQKQQSQQSFQDRSHQLSVTEILSSCLICGPTTAAGHLFLGSGSGAEAWARTEVGDHLSMGVLSMCFFIVTLHKPFFVVFYTLTVMDEHQLIQPKCCSHLPPALTTKRTTRRIDVAVYY